MSCHMPYIQHASVGEEVAYGRSDHTIPIPRPQFDEALGVMGACSSCHVDRPVSELEADAERWWGLRKPHRPEISALLAGLGEQAVIEGARAGPRGGLSKVMAIDRWVTEVEFHAQGLVGLETDVGRALLALVRDPDVDVAAVALAALHATGGDRPEVRALLDGFIGGPDVVSDVTARWNLALLQWAEAAKRLAGQEAELHLLRKAQEVRPRDPFTLLALAAGLAEAGDLDQSVSVYLSALQVDPSNALALVNVGQVLEVLGREGEAARAYNRAVEVRPTEALAHLNLGNSFFRQADFESAIRSYSEAVRFDPGLGSAHFYLGVALVNTGQPVVGLRHLYEARDLRPDDEAIQDVITQMEAALGRE